MLASSDQERSHDGVGMDPPPPPASLMLAHLNRALSDRYVVERELGRGGMATVWLAAERRVERAVATKVLHPALAGAIGADRSRAR